MMMGGNGGEAMQVVYMEIEGIKLAVQLTKDALKIAWQIAKFLICSLKDAPYKKTQERQTSKI